MAPHNPYESIGYHCSLTAKVFFSSVIRRLKGTGIAPAQFRALAHLIADGPMSQSELVQNLSIAKSTGAKLIDRMERDGWVIRQPDSIDKRINRLVLTKKARSIWEEVSQARQSVMKQAYKGLKPREIENIKHIMAQIRENLSELT